MGSLSPHDKLYGMASCRSHPTDTNPDFSAERVVMLHRLRKKDPDEISSAVYNNSHVKLLIISKIGFQIEIPTEKAISPNFLGLLKHSIYLINKVCGLLGTKHF